MFDWLRKQQENLRRQGELAELGQQAMTRARYDFTTGNFVVVDIGLLVYHSTDHPKITRTVPIPTDARWLRPFVEMYCNQGIQDVAVRLDLLDSKGNIHFAENKIYTLKGRTRIVTANWLPLDNKEASLGRWALVVYVNNAPIAVHTFHWEAVRRDEILDELYEDGEINENLQEAVKKGKFRKMSLDELLGNQED
jgi:hypothetical protein